MRIRFVDVEHGTEEHCFFRDQALFEILDGKGAWQRAASPVVRSGSEGRPSRVRTKEIVHQVLWLPDECL